MALVVKQNKRFEHPTEPETWFVAALPLSAGDLAGLRTDGQQIGMTLDLLAAVLKAWSYEQPITSQSVDALDIETYTWLSQQIMADSGIRSEDEKKDSASNSSRTLALVEGDSPKSSGI
jgi:hypothetical protein